MKKILLFVTLLISIATFSQTDYSRGFSNGYKEGYCYNDFACISPIPPITPIPLIGESYDNYQDGYNRGFKKGLEDKQAKKNSDNYNGQGNNSYNQQNNTTKQQYVSSYVSPNYDLLLKALEMKQVQYEKNEQIKKEKTIGMMSQVKAYYNSLNVFPDKISDGWHKVISMNNYDFCEERKVYVSNNQVTKYVIDDWKKKTISYPVTINKAKAIVQLIEDDGTTGDIVELYFLEYINNPNSYTSSPLVSGKVSFWSSAKRTGDINIYVEGDYIGKLTSYFQSSPNCGQNETLSFEFKPGIYNYKAICDKGNWSGTIRINSDDCTLHELARKK